MRAYLRAALVVFSALGFGGMALGQSSSPFSGLFGRGSQSEGPVDLQITVAGNQDGLDREIRNSSLIKGALDEDRTTGQDVFAAARADYARILGLLYDKGFYSPVINITLDGVEAAEVAPLDAPRVVRKVVIRVDPGPGFKFSRAQIAPVAPGSDIPGEYAVGETAGTGTIKAAAAAGVDGWRNDGHAKADVGSQSIVADHDQNTVDSRIGLNPGPVSISPNGRWLAYTERTGDDSGSDVFVVPFPNTSEARTRVSTGGGSSPIWAHSGRELFYRTPNRELVTVDVRADASFSTGDTEILFTLDEAFVWNGPGSYDVSLDDERFVMIAMRTGGLASELIVTENFFGELRERVGN